MESDFKARRNMVQGYTPTSSRGLVGYATVETLYKWNIPGSPLRDGGLAVH